MMTEVEMTRKNALGVRSGAARAGLSTLEFIGCTMAVVGGAWLGALYLGVDLRNLAHTALAEADLLDKMPTGWRPTAARENAMTREQLVTTLREELGSLRNELASLRSGEPKPEAVAKERSSAAPEVEQSDSTPAASKEKTLAYWRRINDIALAEAALQRDAESASNETNGAKVFAIKGRISRFAAKSVEAVPSEGVDASVVQFGRQLGLWYDDGGELYERAVRIWETPIDNQSRENLNKEWRRAELQYRNEAHLLSEKAASVRSAASRQFAEEFPEFAKPMPLTDAEGGVG